MSGRLDESEARLPVEDEEEPVAAARPDVESGAEAWSDSAIAEPPVAEAPEHAPAEFELPDGVNAIEGSPRGGRRPVGIVVSRFNGAFTGRLLASALEELDRADVPRELVTVMTVPGAFELPLAAMALAKTRRHSCIVALGCVIRGETAHFDLIAAEAASGLQLAALETGVPVSFGVLTVEDAEQAEARIDKGAEAVRSALEMVDAFAQLRATAVATG